MTRFKNVQEVADFLLQFDFIITNGQEKGKFLCEFIKPGVELFCIEYQCNPVTLAKPPATAAFAFLVSRALDVDERDIDDFADELGFDRPSAALRAYEACKKAYDWLRKELSLSASDLYELYNTLKDNMDEIEDVIAKTEAERDAKRAFEHPAAPKGFSTIQQLQVNLALGDYGDQITQYGGNIANAIQACANDNVDIHPYDLFKWIPDNYEWFIDAYEEGLLDGCHGNLIEMTQMAQYLCFKNEMYENIGDIAKYAALEGLKDAGVYALSDEVYYDVFDDITIDFKDTSMNIEDFYREANCEILNRIDVALYEALGSSDEILEDGEMHGEFEAIKESCYCFPNPCAMSIETVRDVNEKGYEAAFNEFWEDRGFLPEKSGGETPMSLKNAAKECREASHNLNNHNELTSERDAIGEEH